MTMRDIASAIVAELKAIRDEYHASGDHLSMRVINRAIIRIARKLSGRTDAGRWDDDVGEP